MSTSTSLVDRLRGRRVGVSFSSGFFAFYHHTGVLRALVERGVEPARLAGNSAGALVAALWAAGLAPSEIGARLVGIRREDFWDPTFPFGPRGFGWLAGERFRALLADHLPVHDFESCRAPLALGAVDLADGRVRHLARGSLVEAAYASSAFPYLFEPAEIDGRTLWDGGFAEKTPLVPFLEGTELDAVVVSYTPMRDAAAAGSRGGWRRFVPPIRSLLADTPIAERIARDRTAVRLLRERGVEVYVLAPPRVRLGPFSLQRGAAALEAGYEGAARLLDGPAEALDAPAEIDPVRPHPDVD